MADQACRVLSMFSPAIVAPRSQGTRFMPTPQEYLDRAAAALVELADAKTESERTRLKRAHGAYLRLSTHQAEAEARAAIGPARRIAPEKSAMTDAKPSRWTIK